MANEERLDAKFKVERGQGGMLISYNNVEIKATQTSGDWYSVRAYELYRPKPDRVKVIRTELTEVPLPVLLESADSRQMDMLMVFEGYLMHGNKPFLTKEECAALDRVIEKEFAKSK